MSDKTGKVLANLSINASDLKSVKEIILNQQQLIERLQAENERLSRCLGNSEQQYQERCEEVAYQMDRAESLETLVETLKTSLNEAIEALVAETSEPGSVSDSEIHALRTTYLDAEQLRKEQSHE